MTTLEAPEVRPRRRRAVLVVSLVAILILGVIGASLLVLTGDSGSGQPSGEPAPPTGPDAEVEAFSDPQGAYTIDVDPGWEATSNASAPQIESWFTGTGTPDFRDNINILTQEDIGLDLDQYMQLLDDQARESVGEYELKEFRVVTTDTLTETTSTDPTQLGVIAYEGTQNGKAFGFFFVASVVDGDAVLATLTTAQARFPEVRAQIEPYLLTLRQT